MKHTGTTTQNDGTMATGRSGPRLTALSAATPTTVASTVQHVDEYGQQLGAATAATYGWLRSYALSTSGGSGLSCLGSRAYDPAEP